MKSKIILSLLLCLRVGKVFAQRDVIQGFGASMYVLYPGKHWGVNYSYRNNFKEIGSTGSWSITLAPAVGGHYNDLRGTRFIIDLPVTICYNIGYKSVSQHNTDGGVFIGVGAGGHYIYKVGFGFGPEYVLGVRGRLGNTPIEVKVDYHNDWLHLSTDFISVHLNFLM